MKTYLIFCWTLLNNIITMENNKTSNILEQTSKTKQHVNKNQSYKLEIIREESESIEMKEKYPDFAFNADSKNQQPIETTLTNFNLNNTSFVPNNTSFNVNSKIFIPKNKTVKKPEMISSKSQIITSESKIITSDDLITQNKKVKQPYVIDSQTPVFGLNSETMVSQSPKITCDTTNMIDKSKKIASEVKSLKIYSQPITKSHFVLYRSNPIDALFYPMACTGHSQKQLSELTMHDLYYKYPNYTFVCYNFFN